MQATEPRTRKWTKAEYYQMADLGWFEGQRAELVEGEIVVMSPQKFDHGATADRIATLLRNAIGDRFWVRMQLPLSLAGESEPEPDVSVVPGSIDQYTEHPTSAVLVVEVSESSLRYDLRTKSQLYARAAIPDYWVVDLANREVHVHRRPGQEGYADVRAYAIGDEIELLGQPGVRIAVAKMMGK